MGTYQKVPHLLWNPRVQVHLSIHLFMICLFVVYSTLSILASSKSNDTIIREERIENNVRGNERGLI